MTRKTLCLDDFKCNSYTFHSYYIDPHYPQNWKLAIQKKTLERFLQHTHLLRESYSSSREKSLWSLLLPSPIVIPWKDICTQIQSTHIQSIESVLELRKHWVFAKKKPMRVGKCNGTVLGIWEASEYKTSRIPLVVRAWRA